MAIRAICKLKSASPYSQSRHIEEPRGPNENPVDFELRTWRKRLHVDKAGHVFIPAMAFTNSLAESAKYLSMPIPGDRQKTFTKHFESGVRVIEDLTLKTLAKDVEAEEFFVPSDGKRGGGRRVTKYFPVIPSWEGTVVYWINDPTVTKEAFTRAVRASGTLIGIGRFRPRNMGYYGMFEVLEIKWMGDEHGEATGSEADDDGDPAEAANGRGGQLGDAGAPGPRKRAAAR